MDKDALIQHQKQLIEALSQQLKQQSHQLDKLNQQVEKLLRVLYGKKSEKGIPKQSSESPTSNNDPIEQYAEKAPSNKSVQQKPKRSPLPSELEHVDVFYDIPEDDKFCPSCDMPLRRIGQRVSERLDYVPARLIVKRHIRYKWACYCDESTVFTAKLPNQAIEKGIPGPGLLAEVLVSKYQDAMPLYRQMQRFKRLGYTTSDSTMGGWVRECALLLHPLLKVMREDMMMSKKLHTDDTPVPVLAKGKTRQGRLWVYLADHSTPNAMCLYDYTPTRRAEGPAAFLEGYSGYLQADAYSGYDPLYKEQDVTEVGCFAHMRRKFYDVAKAAKGSSHAADIVELIGQVYEVEREARDKISIERYYYRKKHAKPKLKKLKRKMNKCRQQITIGSPLNKAISYADRHWQALCRYLADGDLDIDNNKAERAIKPLVIGRKNWMFAGSHQGGEWAAVIYSIIETCKMNDVNPFMYIADVLERLPYTLDRDIRQFLPYHWKKQQPCS